MYGEKEKPPQGDTRRVRGEGESSHHRSSSVASRGSQNRFPDIEVNLFINFLEYYYFLLTTLYVLKERISCDLLLPYQCGIETKIGRGVVYPTSDDMVDERSIAPGFIKVQVDSIEEQFGVVRVPDETRTEEISLIMHLPPNFIQWPRFAINV